jgi:regulatory protein
MARAAPSLRARALRYLAAREHSRAELKRKLASAEPGPPAEPAADSRRRDRPEPAAEAEIETLLDEFERKGWLSESRLADQMVQAARGRYGSRRVLDKLRQKGATDQALDAAAHALQQQDLESARALWRKRFGKPPADLRERARQARFLAGRGFSSEVIREVLGGEVDEPG